MTKKEYEIQKALGLADHFLLELVVGPSCNRKEVEKVVAKYSYNSRLLRWQANTNCLYYNYNVGASSYIFDIKCPFEIMSKIRTELGANYINSQMATWSTD